MSQHLEAGLDEVSVEVVPGTRAPSITGGVSRGRDADSSSRPLRPPQQVPPVPGPSSGDAEPTGIAEPIGDAVPAGPTPRLTRGARRRGLAASPPPPGVARVDLTILIGLADPPRLTRATKRARPMEEVLRDTTQPDEDKLGRELRVMGEAQAAAGGQDAGPADAPTGDGPGEERPRVHRAKRRRLAVRGRHPPRAQAGRSGENAPEDGSDDTGREVEEPEENGAGGANGSAKSG